MQYLTNGIRRPELDTVGCCDPHGKHDVLADSEAARLKCVQAMERASLSVERIVVCDYIWFSILN